MNYHCGRHGIRSYFCFLPLVIHLRFVSSPCHQQGEFNHYLEEPPIAFDEEEFSCLGIQFCNQCWVDLYATSVEGYHFNCCYQCILDCIKIIDNHPIHVFVLSFYPIQEEDLFIPHNFMISSSNSLVGTILKCKLQLSTDTTLIIAFSSFF